MMTPRSYHPWITQLLLIVLCVGCWSTTTAVAQSNEPTPNLLKISWDKRYLEIRGEFPGNLIRVHYLEAYCRPGSTDREWKETVIQHDSVLTSRSSDGTTLKIEDRLEDGVLVKHTIEAVEDEVTFEVVAHNPTSDPSEAHWAQPCIRVDAFTGQSRNDARTLVPEYARQCFIFVDQKMMRLPTEPWADEARYVPGQVYCPAHVDRDDVNPRPLSQLVPSNGLCGCLSADGKKMMAVAWEPYQEIFQGVVTCMHNDFRIGGLQPGETKRIRGKIYIVDANIPALLKRFEADFPEQAQTRPQR